MCTLYFSRYVENNISVAVGIAKKHSMFPRFHDSHLLVENDHPISAAVSLVYFCSIEDHPASLGLTSESVLCQVLHDMSMNNHCNDK